MSGTLFVVATPIGNLEDLSARGLRVLRQVSVIAAEDTRRTARLLAYHAINTPTTSLHRHNEKTKSTSLIERLQRGDDIALVSDAGTPTLSDPGWNLIRLAIDAGIRISPVPGPSALLAALTGSGLAAETFTFLGFPPTRLKDRKAWLSSLAGAGRAVVFFEAPHRIKATLSQIQRTVGDCEVSVGRELTKVHEEFVRGPISTVIDYLKNPHGEFTVVANMGRTTESKPTLASPNRASILRDFGLLTESGRLSRRHAIRELARSHGLKPNEVYDVIENAKKSG